MTGATLFTSSFFNSAKKVAVETNSPVAVASFHSTSKGFLGECGFRGGFCELYNFDPEVKAELYKLCSMHLCSNLAGQVMTSLMVRPPTEGDESYGLYAEERDTILGAWAAAARAFVELAYLFGGFVCLCLHLVRVWRRQTDKHPRD
jgi:alanine transaminase